MWKNFFVTSFQERKYNDEQKQQYCYNHNIPLLLLRKTDNLDNQLTNFIGEIYE